MRIGFLFRRIVNAWRKKRSGLRFFGENITPDVPNDLFQAHASIYEFAKEYARGGRTLDIGCGAGYGTSMLAHGASSAVGADLDRFNIGYAARKYRGENLSFEVGDAERLSSHMGPFELIVASNVLEHLLRPEAAVSCAARLLSPQGTFLVAVPPIFDAGSRRANEAIRLSPFKLFYE
jgi:2-polyprenyl-3-methyl-5-hydroxy-6-metoxy-1,4-benzoquinol methylase